MSRLALATLMVASVAVPAGRAHAAASLLGATLEPHEITIGQSAKLTIKTVGADLGGLTLPSVGGLQLRIVAQSRRAEDVQGATVVVTSTTIRVTPVVAGDFEIPGMAPNAPSLTLHVDVDDSIGKAPHARQPPPGPPPSATGLDGIRLTPDGAAFVRWVPPKRAVFVGESVPVDIEVGLRPGFVTSLNGLPTLTSSDFTLGNLSRQPERSERTIGGNAYSVLTWHSVLAPVKPGTYTLSFAAPVTVRIRLRPEQEAKLDDLLGDPFLQNIYGKTVKKELKVESPAATLSVSALPVDARPGDFSGAVGTFSVTSDIAPTAAALGDPLTLRLHVRGAGNFDRVDSRMLEHLPEWKTYPPTVTFKPADAVGYTGEKTFEQPLVARAVGPQTLPPLHFSYFDPAAGRYMTATAAPLTVTIAPALGDVPPPSEALPSEARAPAEAPAQAAASGDGLRPDHPVPSAGAQGAGAGSGDSAAALYDRANAHARAGQWGLAVLDYDRAMRKTPFDPDLRANLAWVRARARVAPDEASLLERLFAAAGPTVCAGLCALGAAALGGGAVRVRRDRRRSAWGVGILVAGAGLVLLAVLGAFRVWPSLHAAVVVASVGQVRAAPAPMSDSLFELTEAERVRSLADHDDFVLVQTRDGRRGWMARADLGFVVPRPVDSQARLRR